LAKKIHKNFTNVNNSNSSKLQSLHKTSQKISIQLSRNELSFSGNNRQEKTVSIQLIKVSK